ncbi:MAG: HPr(Ser) kinase/phosphatase [Oscillospiraceae bacterium]|nr:HPr(Ser) kinase/phosphatase [Oscillospiraceae bacterium]
MSKAYSVSLDTLVREHRLTVVRRGKDYDNIRISNCDVSRPALPLAGFYDYFDPTRVQTIGKLELTYLEEMSPGERGRSIDRFMSTGIRFVIVAHGMPVPEEMLRAADRNQVTILTTEQTTSDFMAQLIINLNSWLAPGTTIHGVLMEIHGEGVLITGDSGVGKSENAMALLSRGHRLVADDAIEVKRTSQETLIGTAPEMIRYFMEIRGIGLIDARHMFGIGAVKQEQAIDLVVHLEHWDDNKTYDRLGNETSFTEILGVRIPYFLVPVRPGRNLAAILELAAMNNRERKMGYNAAQVLVERHDALVDLG